MTPDPITKHRPATILPVHARPSETVVIHWHTDQGLIEQVLQCPQTAGNATEYPSPTLPTEGSVV